MPRGGGGGGVVIGDEATVGFRHDSPRHYRTLVGVLAFVRCHNDGVVAGRPLHSLLHTAPRRGATIIASALTRKTSSLVYRTFTSNKKLVVKKKTWDRGYF